MMFKSYPVLATTLGLVILFILMCVLLFKVWKISEGVLDINIVHYVVGFVFGLVTGVIGMKWYHAGR